MKEFKKFKTQDISYLKSAPNGIAGDITRVDESSVEPAMLVGVGSPAVYPSSFGVPMQYVTVSGNTGIQQFNTGSETAASFAGVLVRRVPAISGALADDSAETGQNPSPGSPYPLQVQDLLVRGYINVVCVAGSPLRGGTVYVQVVADTGAPAGSFRADGTDGGKAVALSATQAEWASDGLDANGNAELRVYR